MNQIRNKKGFTLMELLVVVLIIGILAGVALPKYTDAVEKAKLAEGKSLLKAMSDAQIVCLLEQDRYNCTGDRFFQNTSFQPPTPILETGCLDTAPCFRTKDWEFWSDEYLYAGRVKNGEIFAQLIYGNGNYGEPFGMVCDYDLNEEYCKKMGMPDYPSL